MADKIYDVRVVITKTVRVRVPVDDAEVMGGSTPLEAAEEFGLGGKRSWPEFVISEESDHDVDDITEVKAAVAA